MTPITITKYHEPMYGDFSSQPRFSASALVRRVGWSRFVAILLLFGCCAGLFSLVHEHSEDGIADEHHCPVCHLQQSTTLTASIADVQPTVTLQGEVGSELRVLHSIAPRLVPPLRGPPVS